MIPFTVGIARPGQAAPEEVHLYVTGDGGQTWHFYQRQKPDAGRFLFHAGQDGEHWFAVQTVENAQAAVTPESLQPELKVIIDTKQPELDLQVESDASGQVSVRWAASDPQLDAVTFRLEYKSAAATLWQPLTVQKPLEARADYTGQHSWRPATSMSVLQVRAEISDRCGNVTRVIREVQHTSEQGQEQVVLAAQAPAASQPQPTGSPLPPAADTTPPAIVWPTEPTTTAPVPHHTHSGPWTASPSQPIASNATAPGPSQVTHPGNAPTPTMTAPPPDVLAADPAPQVGAEPAAPDAQAAAPDTPTTADAAALPAAARMSNSRRFELDYIVETAVDVGVKRVELWYTRDQAQSWTLYGEDSDQQSPFLVEMDQDGLFGFKIVAQSHQGVSTGPPRPGTAADIWIRIDATPPAGRLTAARFGRGDATGTLQIWWESHDERLADSPVTLLYGETPDGPWRVIADGLTAQGRYDWRVGEHVPAEIYLRLEVRDQAGNIFADTLTDAIASNGLAPQTRIRGMRPAPEF